jgi:hypothetical protein
MSFLQIPPISVLLTLQDSNEYDVMGDDIQIYEQPLYALILSLVRKSLPGEVSIHVAAQPRIFKQIENDFLDENIDYLHQRTGTDLLECFQYVVNSVDHELLLWINARQLQRDYLRVLSSALDGFASGSSMIMSVTTEPLLFFNQDRSLSGLVADSATSLNSECNQPFFARSNLIASSYYNKAFIGLRRGSLHLLNHFDPSAISLVQTSRPIFIEDLKDVFDDRTLIGMMTHLLS